MKEWQVARQWLLPALEPEDTEQDVVQRLLEGSAQLWLGERCAMVTEIVSNPRVLHGWLAGGDLDEILSLVPGVAAYARTWGCVEATLEGRLGWARAMKVHGFTGSGLLRKVL